MARASVKAQSKTVVLNKCEQADHAVVNYNKTNNETSQLSAANNTTSNTTRNNEYMIQMQNRA
jgi:hypothetical protein